MADITTGDAYVDTVAGTDDTSHGTSTGSGACKSLAYILASRVVTLTGNLTIHCAGATLDSVGGFNMSNKTSTSYKMIIKGDRWGYTTDGKWNNNYYHIAMNDDNYLITCYDANIEFDSIQFLHSYSGGSNRIFRYYGDGNSTDVANMKNCICWQTAGTTQAAFVQVATHASANLNVINCVFIHNNIGILVTSGLANSYNNTFHACTTAISGVALVKNCLFDGSTTADFNAAWTAGSDNNSTTRDVTWNPSGSYNHDPCADFNFADQANHDFRLTETSGDPNARNSGATISACSPDPLGTTRPGETNYSRGAFEYVGAGATPVEVDAGLEEAVAVQEAPTVSAIQSLFTQRKHVKMIF
jgi:hypothetical protein